MFLQPVGTAFYSDLELLRLVEQVDRLHPFAFYIVDTLGSMLPNQVTRQFHLIDENLDSGVKVGFHGHNNLQLAFSNAQVLMGIQSKRDLILDSSVFGMGRGAGNLPHRADHRVYQPDHPIPVPGGGCVGHLRRVYRPPAPGDQWGTSGEHWPTTWRLSTPVTPTMQRSC